MELESLSFKSLPLFHNRTKALTGFSFLPCLPSPFFPPRLRRNSGDKSRRLPASKPQNSDEFPVAEYDESYMSEFTDKKEELMEEEFRRRNWTERGWAPWEEILTPEAEFTRKSLDEGEEIPLETPEAIEAFKMLTAKYRREKMEESGMSEEEWKKKQFEIKGDIPHPLKTEWNFPVVLLKIPPRDWPPRGWRVDKRELAFIREAHKLQALRVDATDVENPIDYQEASFERYEVFLKQYNVYVEMNRERLEEEAFEVDQDYYPGRRKRGKDYKEDMYELPFIFPGQICAGKVTSVHLHQGAFVDFGCVHDGWVPIRGNDWYWIRHHIKVGMNVVVEVLAKRDPYRFRFPIEMRLVYPNIDHLIFNKFEYPPAFHRDSDTNPEQFARDSGRPPVPRKRTKEKFEEQSLLLDHPHVPYVWQLHVAEQMILDDEEQNPEKYKNKINASGSVEEAPFNEEERVQYTEKYFKKALIPHVILNTNVKELDMDAARAERQMNNRLRKEAEERGEKFEVEKLRRNMEMDDLNFIHWRRSLEEREALIRDISCRRALDLPVEEPERYKDKSFFPKKYDPSDPFYRYDYWGVPKGSKEDKEKQEEIDRHKSIVGNGFLWSDRSYEDVMKQNEFHKNKEAQERQMPNEAVNVEGSSNRGNSNSNSSELPVVNGKQVFDK